MIDNIIINAIKPVCKNVERMKYTKKAEPYITYMLVLANDIFSSNDEPEATEYLYRLDLYSKKDYNALLLQIKTALETAGFYNINFGPELYENDTELYHMPIDINYTEYKE